MRNNMILLKCDLDLGSLEALISLTTTVIALAIIFRVWAEWYSDQETIDCQ